MVWSANTTIGGAYDSRKYEIHDEGMKLYSMGRNRFIELARKADSRYKVCGGILCDTDKINEYIVENCKLDDSVDERHGFNYLDK